MLGFIKGTLECSSLGTFERDSEVVKEWLLLGLKYNIKEGDNYELQWPLLNPFLI